MEKAGNSGQKWLQKLLKSTVMELTGLPVLINMQINKSIFGRLIIVLVTTQT